MMVCLFCYFSSSTWQRSCTKEVTKNPEEVSVLRVFSWTWQRMWSSQGNFCTHLSCLVTSNSMDRSFIVKQVADCVLAVLNFLILSFIFLSVHYLFLSFVIEPKYFLSKRLQEGCNIDLTLLYRFCQELHVESRGCVCGRQGFILFARDCSGVKSAD